MSDEIKPPTYEGGTFFRSLWCLAWRRYVAKKSRPREHPCARCECDASSHAVDDEGRRGCRECECTQYEARL